MDRMPLLVYFYVVLRVEPSASRILGKCSATELQPQPPYLHFKTQHSNIWELYYYEILALEVGYTGLMISLLRMVMYLPLFSPYKNVRKHPFQGGYFSQIVAIFCPNLTGINISKILL